MMVYEGKICLLFLSLSKGELFVNEGSEWTVVLKLVEVMLRRSCWALSRSGHLLRLSRIKDLSQIPTQIYSNSMVCRDAIAVWIQHSLQRKDPSTQNPGMNKESRLCLYWSLWLTPQGIFGTFAQWQVRKLVEFFTGHGGQWRWGQADLVHSSSWSETELPVEHSNHFQSDA